MTEYANGIKWRQGSRFLAENSKEKDKQQGIGCDAFATGRVFSTNWREDPVRTSTSDQKRIKRYIVSPTPVTCTRLYKGGPGTSDAVDGLL